MERHAEKDSLFTRLGTCEPRTPDGDRDGDGPRFVHVRGDNEILLMTTKQGYEHGYHSGMLPLPSSLLQSAVRKSKEQPVPPGRGNDAVGAHVQGPTGEPSV